MLWRVILSISSAIILGLAYPKTDWWLLAWIGLVPMLHAIDGEKPKSAFKLSYLTGFLFFTITLYWFIHVTWIGAFFLIAYLSLYFGLFGIAFSYLSKLKLVARVIVLSSVWVSLEYIRSTFLSGFGWVTLGHSQYKNISLIQMAEFTGVYGVSFLLIFANLLNADLIKKSLNQSPLIKGLIGGFIALYVLCFNYMDPYAEVIVNPRATSIRVMVVQPNIDQDLKWVPQEREGIVRKHIEWSQKYYGKAKPPLDLIIWPETSFPGLLWESPELMEEVKTFVREHSVPLLIGAVTQEEEDYYNSAILLSERGALIQQYNKLHLVPFGEFIPLRNVFPFIADLIPIADFSSGEEYTIFSLKRDKVYQGHTIMAKTKRNVLFSFASLICFEDTVAYLARGFTQKGAHFLVNITNDGWFKNTKAPFMHLQAAVFRAIENRRSLVRAANTGLSCFIDPFGRIQGGWGDQAKIHENAYVEGIAVGNVTLSRQQTFYTKFGDIFTYLCFVCILWGIVIRAKGEKS